MVGPMAHRALNRRDRSLLYPMITRWDNTAATEVLGIVGDGALYALAQRVGMTQFAVAPIWGESHITAREQTEFFLHIGRYIARRHRRHAMRLLASITPSQRWESGKSRRRAGSSISKVAGVREPGSSTIRWRWWSGAVRPSR